MMIIAMNEVFISRWIYHDESEHILFNCSDWRWYLEDYSIVITLHFILTSQAFQAMTMTMMIIMENSISSALIKSLCAISAIQICANIDEKKTRTKIGENKRSKREGMHKLWNCVKKEGFSLKYGFAFLVKVEFGRTQ